MGNLNTCSDKWEGGRFANWQLAAERKTCDSTINKKGRRKLVEFMENRDLLLINGRANSDSPAHYTYISPTGKSIIDLAWANENMLDIMQDLEVTDLIHSSDHLPIKISLNSQSKSKKHEKAKTAFRPKIK